MTAAIPCGIDDPLIVGGNNDARRAACDRPFGDANDHRLAADIRERLAGQARR
jgi:hypothetical protein